MKRVIKNILNNFGLSNTKDREKWTKEQLKRLPKRSSILDIGAGECKFKDFCNHLEYTSQDFSQYKPKDDNIRDSISPSSWSYSSIDIVSDITQIPVADNSFDNILCTEVFEHIIDPISAVKEIRRILKPNGTLILTTPFASITHFEPYHFYSGFNQFWFKQVFSDKNGWKNFKLDKNGNYYEFLSQEIIRVINGSKTNFGPNVKISFKCILLLAIFILKSQSKKHFDSNFLLYFGNMLTCQKRDE